MFRANQIQGSPGLGLNTYLENESILPTQTITLRQIWLEDMVLAMIPNPHIDSMFKSVYNRGGCWTVSMEHVQILIRENL